MERGPGARCGKAMRIAPQQINCGAPLESFGAGSTAPSVGVCIKNGWSLDEIRLRICRDYYARITRGAAAPIWVDASEYLNGSDESWGDSSLLCPEMPLPEHLTDQVRLQVRSSRPLFDTQALALVHAGRRGRASPLHYDWDHSWVAHINLLGEKIFYLIPPESSWLLAPLANISIYRLPRFDVARETEFLARFRGQKIVLPAGSGVLFPSMWWHAVAYHRDAFSLSVRFEAAPGGRPFGVFPRSWWLQQVVWHLFAEDYLEAGEVLQRLSDLFFREEFDWRERYVRFNTECRLILKEWGYHPSRPFELGVSPEYVMAQESIEAAYDLRWAHGEYDEDVDLEETAAFLFAGMSPPPRSCQERIVRYATSHRRGLQPRQGLVQIRNSGGESNG